MALPHAQLLDIINVAPLGAALANAVSTSLIKTEIVVFPILILTTVLFSELIWRMAKIPGPNYPFTQQVWHQNALQ